MVPTSTEILVRQRLQPSSRLCGFMGMILPLHENLFHLETKFHLFEFHVKTL